MTRPYNNSIKTIYDIFKALPFKKCVKSTDFKLCLKYVVSCHGSNWWLFHNLQENGLTPVHLAASQNSVDMIKLMFEMNPDKLIDSLSLIDNLGQTPLHSASSLDRVAAVDYLIEQVTSKYYQIIHNPMIHIL